jgi:alpha-glucosidase
VEGSTTIGEQWWRSAAVYQVYLRSFADGNGDGVGDLAGLLNRLSYIAGLGADAIWLNPWYPSPMADGGYDVADYRSIDPVFGTLAQAAELIEHAHALGIRVIIDIVPNHCSAAHPWFREALEGGLGCSARKLFWFRPGRGTDGGLPPNDWQSRFGGPAWTRITEPDGTPGEWYLHLYDSQQPDLNWDNPRVRDEFDEILRFWLDRGVDGFRVDVADKLMKHPDLPDVAGRSADDHPYADLDGIHDIYRHWRQIADSYLGDRVFVGEIWPSSLARFVRYLRHDELHTAFNFAFLKCPWDEAALRDVIGTTLSAHSMVGASVTWVLSNHDVVRHVTRYGKGDGSTLFLAADDENGRANLALGTRRARAAALLAMALPGSVYIYQGDELGLPEVENLPSGFRQDPIFFRTGGHELGRDGCRVPLPWSGEKQPFGFTEQGGSPWLPQPKDWRSFTVESQDRDPASMLNLYRRALGLRRDQPSLRNSRFRWIDAPPGLLGFVRGNTFANVTNVSSISLELPPHRQVLLTTEALVGSTLPPDSTAWLALS